MTNPTLVNQDTAWRGWTTTEMQEKVLGSRGLTLGTATERTLATAQEQLEALDAIKSAIVLLQAEFPSLWTIRTYSASWTSGDHTISLPSNIMAILAVTFGGNVLAPMKRDTYQRLLRSSDEGGDISDDGLPVYYRVTGFSDQGSGSKDWRIAMRLHPAPDGTYGTDTLDVEYIALGVDITTVGDPIALFPHLQGWVFQRAKELWAADNGDTAQAGASEAERGKHERTLNVWVENATKESDSRATWKYPSRGRRTRGRRN